MGSVRRPSLGRTRMSKRAVSRRSDALGWTSQSDPKATLPVLARAQISTCGWVPSFSRSETNGAPVAAGLSARLAHGQGGERPACEAASHPFPPTADAISARAICGLQKRPDRTVGARPSNRRLTASPVLGERGDERTTAGRYERSGHRGQPAAGAARRRRAPTLPAIRPLTAI
jgi:hypothetical protein